MAVEEIIFSGHTVITNDKIEIQCDNRGDLMIFYNDEPIFMLDWHKLAEIHKIATCRRSSNL